MKQRKQYIIDKSFQLKITFSIIGMVAIIIAVLIVGIGTNMVVNNRSINKNNLAIKQNNKNIKNINEIQDNIVHFLSSSTLASEDKIYKNAIREVVKNHVSNMAKMKAIMTSNEKIMKSNRDIMKYNNMLAILIIIVIIGGTILMYIQLIRKTHKISGPIYVISMYMRDLIEGKYPNCRKLRDSDELKDFYTLFQKLVETLKERHGKK